MHPLLRILPGALVSIFGVGAPAAPPAGASARASAAGDWPTFQANDARTGVAPGARSFHALHRRFARRLDGQVYGQPLIAGGRVYVATENNSVYAFTTAGAQVFRHHFGRPVPKSDLPCGNIDPTGITGTPAISGNRLYAVTFSGHRHVLVAVDTNTGAVRMQKRLDPPNPIVQQERGALLVFHGRVYVPYGGLDGDCGPYRGYRRGPVLADRAPRRAGVSERKERRRLRDRPADGRNRTPAVQPPHLRIGVRGSGAGRLDAARALRRQPGRAAAVRESLLGGMERRGQRRHTGGGGGQRPLHQRQVQPARGRPGQWRRAGERGRGRRRELISLAGGQRRPGGRSQRRLDRRLRRLARGPAAGSSARPHWRARL